MIWIGLITSILHLFQPKYDHFGLTNNDISTLLQLALKDNYFDFFGQCYAQGDCLAMGNRLSIVAANCFVYTLELKLFQLLGRTPKLWIRFIDDIFIMDTFDNLHPDIILNNLNNLHPNIHVTSTLAKNTDTTNFLDIYTNQPGTSSNRCLSQANTLWISS